MEATASATSHRSEPAERYGQSVTLPNSSLDLFGTCIFTGLVVLAAYAHLLTISMSYKILFIIPVIILAFIGAVARKFYYLTGGWQQCHDNNSETGFANRVDMLVVLAIVAFGPQLVQLVCSNLDMFLGPGRRQNDCFLISHFLFFFSSTVGALQVMMAALRVEKVSQVLWMTFMVVLNMAFHAKVADWVGEDMVLVCMPELIAALSWFFDHFDHGGYTMYIIDSVISFESVRRTIFYAVVMVLLSMFAYESIGIPMFIRVLDSCTLSGMLSWSSTWMISGSHDSAKMPIQLLKCSAHVCSAISASLVSLLVILHLRPDVFNLVERVTRFNDVVKAAQTSVGPMSVAVLGCWMFTLLFLFMALGNEIRGGAPSSTFGHPLLSSIRQEMEHGLSVGRRRSSPPHLATLVMIMMISSGLLSFFLSEMVS